MLDEFGKELLGIAEDKRNFSMLGAEEALADAVVEHRSERGVVVEHIEAAARFVVNAQLAPSEDFAELFIGSQAAG